MNTVCYAGGDDSLKQVQEKTKLDSLKKAADLKTAEKQKADSLEAIKNLPIIVRRVYNYNDQDTSANHLSSAGIGDIIVIEVDNLESLLRRSKSSNPNQNISLFINGRKIDNIKPISGAPDKDKGTLQYRLDRNPENDKTWADILGAPPFFKDDFFIKDVKISVGLENEFAYKTLSNENNFSLIRIHRGWFWACFFIIILYLFIVFIMVRDRGLLRDRSINLSAIGINTSANTYSLGRFQMAFWFTLTIISFFFIWLITDAYDIITSTVLALIGISAGTSLSAAVIDNSKSTDLLNQTVMLQNELARLNTQISALNNQISTVPAPANVDILQGQLNTAQNRVTEITPLIANNIAILTPQQSEGFFNDILKDVNGISFHRLQMFVWTFVLGLIFLYSVWKRLSMPEFSSTLLALQGLTAGTYLGFKFPEKQA